MMYARFASLGNPSPCHCCLCLHCSAPLRTVKILVMLLEHSHSTVGYHWP
ncbi:hypothetical protein LOK49_Contig187G00001 [Camellia lanceoleosa]|nr:hypothetical protein LOK49_Contig187G00001 [Camellia lanceoleosa]